MRLNQETAKAKRTTATISPRHLGTDTEDSRVTTVFDAKATTTPRAESQVEQIPEMVTCNPVSQDRAIALDIGAMEVHAQEERQSLGLGDAAQAGASTLQSGDVMDVQMEDIEGSVLLFITPQAQSIDFSPADTHQEKPREDSLDQIACKPLSTQQQEEKLDAMALRKQANDVESAKTKSRKKMVAIKRTRSKITQLSAAEDVNAAVEAESSQEGSRTRQALTKHTPQVHSSRT